MLFILFYGIPGWVPRLKRLKEVERFRIRLPINSVDTIKVWVAYSLVGYLVFAVQLLFGWVFGWFAVFGG